MSGALLSAFSVPNRLRGRGFNAQHEAQYFASAGLAVEGVEPKAGNKSQGSKVSDLKTRDKNANAG